MFCLRCHRTTRRPGAAGPCLAATGREAVGPRVVRALRLGYDVYRGSSRDAPAFVLRMACGSHAETRFVGLSRACPGRLRRHPRVGVALDRVRRTGMHPARRGVFVGTLARCRLLGTEHGLDG